VGNTFGSVLILATRSFLRISHSREQDEVLVTMVTTLNVLVAPMIDMIDIFIKDVAKQKQCRYTVNVRHKI